MYRSNRIRRIRSQQRAADQQRDTTQVVLKTTVIRACGQNLHLIYPDAPIENDSWKDTGTIALNIYDVLLRCEFYKNYSNLYDQLRIDSIKVTVTPQAWTQSKEEGPSPGYMSPKSLTLVTAWDRSGLDNTQFIEDPLNTKRYYCTIGNDIETYSSAITRHLNSGGTFNLQRYLYPSTMQEKSQFVNVKDLHRQFTQEVSEPYRYILDSDYTSSSNYPNNPLSNPSIPFKPTFLLSVRSPYKPFTAPTNTIYDGATEEIMAFNKILPSTFSIEFEIVVTFRGLRYDRIL